MSIAEMKTMCLSRELPSDLLERINDTVTIAELRRENESLRRSVQYLGSYVDKLDNIRWSANRLAICCKCGSRDPNPHIGDKKETSLFTSVQKRSFLVCGDRRYCGYSWVRGWSEEDYNNPEYHDSDSEEHGEWYIGEEKAVCDLNCDMECNHWVCSDCVHVQRIRACTGNCPRCLNWQLSSVPDN